MPWRGTSNEYPQQAFSWSNKKNVITFGLKKASYQELWKQTTVFPKIGFDISCKFSSYEILCTKCQTLPVGHLCTLDTSLVLVYILFSMDLFHKTLHDVSNSVNSDQNAPSRALQSGSILF